MADFLLAFMIFAPLVLTFFLKSNGAYLFLSVCAGFVLVTYTANSLKSLLDSLGLTTLNSDNLGLILLLAPPVITLLLGRKAFHGPSKIVLYLIPALCAGGLLALTAAPLMANTAGVSLGDSKFWSELQEIEAGIVGAGALFSLVIVWFGGVSRLGKKHK